MNAEFKPGPGAGDGIAAARAIDELEAQAERHRTPCGDGVHMVWRRWGHGAPVVLLHGGAGSWLHWVRNIASLATHRSVWVPDLPGFGDSDLPPGAHDADTLSPMVLAGMQTLLDDEPYDLVGFSFGALVASCVAAQQPPALRALMLVSVAALGIVGSPPALKPMRGVEDPAARRDVVRWNLHQMMLHDPKHVDDLAILVQQRSAPRDRVKHRTLALGDALFALAAEWRCKVSGIWGTQDVLYRDQMPALRAAADRLNMADTTFLEGAGHWLQYECAEAFNAWLAERIDAAGRGATSRRSGGGHA
ncbi:alpha/beta fold hydrolase [Paraburkholderia sp. BCC1886]|uniref:alpha/beta fold hydrolase n=1 Tax=Paraburkholderia sp. BCC1886 TaxID=2562670 RepID=UPI00118224BD|nr:alpha/beta fold hydrolase [Paraburkholderia sp. BCC1886]